MTSITDTLYDVGLLWDRATDVMTGLESVHFALVERNLLLRSRPERIHRLSLHPTGAEGAWAYSSVPPRSS